MQTKLQRFAARGRYPSVYVHPSRGEVGATDGHAFVVLGAATVEEARDLILACHEPYYAPTPKEAARAFDDALGARTAGVTVSRDTAPDATLRERALSGLEQRVAESLQQLAAREADLVVAKRERWVGRARERLAIARSEARDARRALKRVDVPSGHAVIVGPAAVDLRLVRECLATLGVTQGALSSGDAHDPCVLVARTGLALVMPFRR